MRGIAVFVGGPLDEQVRELPDLIPVYRVAVKDPVYNTADWGTGPMPDRLTYGVDRLTYGVLEYKRTRMRHELNGTVRAIYELDM